MRFLALLLVLAAVPAAAQDRPSAALTLTYVSLVGADIGVTAGCVARGTCQEANPAYRWASHNSALFGATRAVAGAGTLYLVHRWTQPRSWQRYVALGSLVLIQGVVVAHGRRF